MLGHIVCKDGLIVDPEKNAVIVDLVSPTTVKHLYATLGHIGYYRRFMCRYTYITTPLEKFLRKDTPFVWIEEHQKAFNEVKEKLVTTPMLVFPNWTKEFHVHVDASSVALGVALAQPGEGEVDHPIVFASQKLSSTERNYTTTKREGIAMVYCMQKYIHYLIGLHFKLYIDHSVLKHLINKPVLGWRIYHWGGV